jgi:dihydroflavonol-4-reductase
MKTLVTGAAGHIGANLVRELIKEKRTVRALVRDDRRGVEGLDLEVVRGDLLEYQSLVKAVKECDSVFHLAASISIMGDKSGAVFRTNVEGTQNIVRACLERDVKRLVHFSSIHAFSRHPLDLPIDESRDPADSRFPAYDRSKALGNREVKEGIEKGLDAVIVAPTAVLGPHDFKPSRMGTVLIKIYQRRFPALVAGGYDWVDVRDVVRGALAAEKSARCGSEYILSGEWASVRRLAELVETVSGEQPPRFTCPQWLARAAAPFSEKLCKVLDKRPLFTGEALLSLRSHRHINREKAEKELGYMPRPLEETVKETLAWFERKGMLA